VAVAPFRERPAGVIAEVVAALDEWADERRHQRPAARWQKPAALAEALDDDRSRKRRELRGMLARGNLRREYAISMLAMALRPVPVPFDIGLGTDRMWLRDLVATTDVASEPVLGLLTLVRALRTAGDEAIAEGLLRAALRARPQQVMLLDALGQLLGKQQRWQETVEVYATLRGIRPELGMNLANVLIEAGRVKEGLALFERLSKEQKDNPAGPFFHCVALAIVLGRQGRAKEAEEACREAIRLKPDYPLAHNHLGAALYDQGKHKEAEEAFREAIRLKHDDPFAHCNLGIALNAQGRHKEAEKSCRIAIGLKHDLYQAHRDLGIALSKQGRHKEAEESCRQTIRLKPDYHLAHHNLGVALNDQGRHQEAAGALREAIRLKHDFPDTHINLGLALADQGRHKEAEEAYREAIRLKPDDPGAHYNLGLALSKQGRATEAEAAYRTAISLKPDYPEAHCNLGSVLRAQGRFREELASLQKGHELGSKTPGWRYPSATWISECRRLLVLDRLLQRIRDGDAEPANARERLLIASLCQQPYKQLHRTAVRLAADAFSAEPGLADDLNQQPRYNAARSAALAAAGQAEDARLLPDRLVCALRRQALSWLRADLALYEAHLKRDPRFSQATAARLAHWQQDADLASVRDKDALARLPADERTAWRRLWSDVAALLVLLHKTQSKN
jgi:tetratricopeptide (TPR) repeat protein